MRSGMEAAHTKIPVTLKWVHFNIVAGLEKTVADIRISRGVGAADTADGDDVAGIAAGVGVESLDEFRELGIDRV